MTKRTLEKRFTVDEVNALLPSLSKLVGEQLRRQAHIAEKMAEVEQIIGHRVAGFEDLASSTEDTPARAVKKRELIDDLRRCEQGWCDVQALGAVVKDPVVGLCDFLGEHDGEDVWLCWMYDEDQLGYYHALDTGFKDRRPLAARPVRVLH